MFKLNFDGGSNPNPGKCAGAYVLYKDGKVISKGGKYIEHGTNNIGEYTGLLIGLEKSKELGIKNLSIEGDSLLVISQITGKWKVKNKILQQIYNKVIEYIKDLEKVECKHVLREFNKEADSLSDKTLYLQVSWDETFIL